MKHIERKLVEQLPKTDLHCHFDGSIRLVIFIELAQKNDIKLPSFEPQVLMEKLKFGRVRKTLEEYLVGFDYIVATLQKPEDIERAFFECVKMPLAKMFGISSCAIVRFCISIKA